MFAWKAPEYKIVYNLEQFEEVKSSIKQAILEDKPIFIDVETTGATPLSSLDCLYGWLLGVAVCISTEKGWYIPLNHTKDSIRLEEQITTAQFAFNLDPIVSKAGLYTNHNIKFDYKFLWRAGIHLYPRLWDTMNALKIINGDANNKKVALKEVIRDYLDIPYGLIKSFTEASRGNAAEVNPDELGIYAINDVIFTMFVYRAIKPEIDEKFHKLFYEIETPLIPLLAQMEMRGIRIDVDYFKKAKTKGEKYTTQLKTFFEKHYGINIGSTQQVGKYFSKTFKDLDMKIKFKTNNIVTDKDELSRIFEAYRGHPVSKMAKRILSYRTLTKEINTYMDKFPKISDYKYDNGKLTYIIHTNYNQIVNSGRMSSSPNVQNLPKNPSVNIRRGFIPREGYKIIEADWSSAEMRLLAGIAQDPILIKMYKDNPVGADPHTLTAQWIFSKIQNRNISIEEILEDNKNKSKPSMRFAGKTVNFMVVYGTTEFGLSKKLKISKEDAILYLKEYLNLYTGVSRWVNNTKHFIKEHKYTDTLFGRRRYINPIYYPEMKQRYLYDGNVRGLINHIIQGTCADMLKYSLVEIAKRIKDIDTYSLTTVHDSILLEAHNPDEVIPIIKDVMEMEVKGIFMPVDIKVKRSF